MGWCVSFVLNGVCTGFFGADAEQSQLTAIVSASTSSSSVSSRGNSRASSSDKICEGGRWVRRGGGGGGRADGVAHGGGGGRRLVKRRRPGGGGAAGLEQDATAWLVGLAERMVTERALLGRGGGECASRLSRRSNWEGPRFFSLCVSDRERAPTERRLRRALGKIDACGPSFPYAGRRMRPPGVASLEARLAAHAGVSVAEVCVGRSGWKSVRAPQKKKLHAHLKPFQTQNTGPPGRRRRRRPGPHPRRPFRRRPPARRVRRGRGPGRAARPVPGLPARHGRGALLFLSSMQTLRNEKRHARALTPFPASPSQHTNTTGRARRRWLAGRGGRRPPRRPGRAPPAALPGGRGGRLLGGLGPHDSPRSANLLLFLAVRLQRGRAERGVVPRFSGDWAR
jgi:hypothetical protein